MTSPKKTLRTFIAIELNTLIKESIQIVTQSLKSSQADVKWVASDNCHITLKFLECTTQEQIIIVKKYLREISQRTKSFDISLDKLGTFPSMNNPRVIWIGIKDGSEELKALAQDIEANLAKTGFPKEQREFTTHITIGRVRSKKNLKKLIELLREKFITEGKTQRINCLTFFESTLTPQGSIYTVLEKFDFGSLSK